MINLRKLEDHWTVEGARTLFAQLVTHCVSTLHDDAQAIRPDPGDEGIDTIVGDLAGRSKIYQAKFFGAIKASQKAQIRDSWSTCVNSDQIGEIAKWTLCLPIDLSVPEKKWWDKWSKKVSTEQEIAVELWPLSRFQRFYAHVKLKPLFDAALKLNGIPQSFEEVLSSLKADRLIQKLPGGKLYSEAAFVKKLEAAEVRSHRAARTAFYNFELIRESIEQGGTAEEKKQLDDFLVRVFDLWERKYNKCAPEQLGRQFFNDVIDEILRQSNTTLRTALGLRDIHKQGGIHYWAELCHAGWTKDFQNILREEGA